MKKINRILNLIIVAGVFVFGVDNIDTYSHAKVSKESSNIMAVKDPGGGGGH